MAGLAAPSPRLSTRLRHLRLGRAVWPLLAMFDLVLWAVALYGSVFLRLNLEWERVETFDVPAALLVVALVQLVAGFAFGLYTGRHPLGSFSEAGASATAGALSGAALVGASAIATNNLVPISTSVTATTYQITAALALRYLARLIRERRLRPNGTAQHRVLIYGAGEAGALVAKMMRTETNSDSSVVGFLDDDRAKRHLKLSGLPVVGTGASLADAAADLSADTVLIAIPSADRDTINEIADQAQRLGMRVNVVPHISKLIGGSLRVADIHEITLADFLSRDEIHLDHEAIDRFLRGKRVLVTGAGGSIGSQICQTVADFEPAALFKVDNSERALYSLEMNLSGHFDVDHESILADIRNPERMEEVFARTRPEVVFHAAAHKHVPFLEAHPTEGYLTNVVGTYNVLQAAEAAGVETFVNISTDKAADPINVLGYTKRIAERLTATAAQRTNATYMSVRFGNVLGSEGSVVATFREQLRRNEPLTITHPDVTRYFMTIPEAVQLVLQAGAIGGDGDVFVLDMGEPVRIADLATRLAAELRPGMIPKFEVVGLRPGEKLHEVLVSENDEHLSQPHELLHRYAVPRIDDSFVHRESLTGSEILRSLAEQRVHQVPTDLLTRVRARHEPESQATAR